MDMTALSIHSPLGPLTVFEEDGVITSLSWGWHPRGEETGLLALAREQLTDYFDGARKTFSLPLSPGGTPFQRRIWAQMAKIPYGETLSYGTLARNTDSGPRAVAMACARNPIPVIIPCHRVVGSAGKLGGYSGGEGIATKRFLLDMEAAGGPVRVGRRDCFAI